MQRLEVSGAVRHIYVIRRLMVNLTKPLITERQDVPCNGCKTKRYKCFQVASDNQVCFITYRPKLSSVAILRSRYLLPVNGKLFSAKLTENIAIFFLQFSAKLIISGKSNKNSNLHNSSSMNIRQATTKPLLSKWLHYCQMFIHCGKTYYKIWHGSFLKE
jgi:hypothetical protein